MVSPAPPRMLPHRTGGVEITSPPVEDLTFKLMLVGWITAFALGFVVALFIVHLGRYYAGLP